MRAIDDPSDPALADYRHLNDAAARRAVEIDAAEGIFVVEGRLAVQRLVGSTLRVRSLLVAPNRRDQMAPLAEQLDAPLLVAPREILTEVAGFDVHRGVLASVRRPPPSNAAAVLEGTSRCVALEGVNDNENLGAIYRNAVALGVGGVVLDDRSADPLYRRSVRVSLGWSMLVPTARVGGLAEWLTSSPELAHRRVVALTPAPDAVPVDVAATGGLLDGSVVLVVGAEGPGLSAAALAAAHEKVRVPMAHPVDSLNVATAFAVVAAFGAARTGWRPAQE